MDHEKLKHMKETLMCAVEMQLCDLGEVDTKELGEAIDMIKDLEEAIYYSTVTEAMNNPSYEKEWGMKKSDHQQYNDSNQMYTGNNRMYAGGNGRSYMEHPMYADDGRRRRADGTFYYSDGGMSSEGGSTHYAGGEGRDSREGRSYNSRRMYMEAKESKREKAVQLRELENYMQELSQDITEMIADASAEEKQYLEKKITALASKIGQMK